MQGGGNHWAISLDKHDEERGTEPRERYMERARESERACNAGGVATEHRDSVLQTGREKPNKPTALPN